MSNDRAPWTHRRSQAGRTAIDYRGEAQLIHAKALCLVSAQAWSWLRSSIPKGWDANFAANGVEFAELLSAAPVDLAVLDCVLLSEVRSEIDLLVHPAFRALENRKGSTLFIVPATAGTWIRVGLPLLRLSGVSVLDEEQARSQVTLHREFARGGARNIGRQIAAALQAHLTRLPNDIAEGITTVLVAPVDFTQAAQWMERIHKSKRTLTRALEKAGFVSPAALMRCARAGQIAQLLRTQTADQAAQTLGIPRRRLDRDLRTAFGCGPGSVRQFDDAQLVTMLVRAITTRTSSGTIRA